jgi:hypothetical protein
MSDVRDQLDFERTLIPGSLITARWTWSGGIYAEPAQVLRVNQASVRVRILNGYLAGRETTMPRMFANKWSLNNGVFPPK